jgi:hypothetical protein
LETTIRISRYKIDPAQVEQARQALGIKHPVRILIRAFTAGDTYGRYGGLAGEEHRISLDSLLSKRQANRTLWHELAHV